MTVPVLLALMQAGPPALELGSFGSGILGTVVGAIVTLAMFRGRLDVYATRFSDLERRLDKERAEDKGSLERALHELELRFDLQCKNMSSQTTALSQSFESWTREARASLHSTSKDSARREEYLLELVLGIAQKQGVRHRFTDVLTNLQTEREG